MLKDKVLKIVTRDSDKFYDYLILKLKNIEEINNIEKFIKEEELDLYFYINNSFDIKLFIQYSSEKKENVKEKLRKIHTYWRIKFNNETGYKKSSKHSVYFEGKNLILKNIETSSLLKKDLSLIKNLGKLSAILVLDKEYFFMKLEPSFLGFTKDNRDL